MSELLQVTIHEASGLSGGFVSKKDPYVLMKLGGQSHHTTAIQDGGKNPSWEQTFSMTYRGESHMDICVMDKDRMGTDDIMGTGVLDLAAVRATKVYSTNVPITKGNKPAGTVRVTVALKSNIPGAVPGAPAQPGYAPPGGYNPQYPGYAPNPGYPPQPGYGCPPGQGVYPPGQGGYPPAHGGYPPNQGHYSPNPGNYPPPPPQGGYNQHGGGYPPQYPQQGYPPTGGQPNYPPPQGGYPPQGMYPPPQPGYVPPGAYGAGQGGYMPPHPPYPQH